MRTIEDVIKSKPIKDPYHRAALNIMHTAGWLQNRITQVLKPYELSEAQYNVLRILNGQQGTVMSLYEIQDRMVQKMSNVSRLIDKLLDKGLVLRKECADNRRRVDILITAKGITLLEKATPLVQREIKNMFGNITKEKAELINELLDGLRDQELMQ